MDTYSRYNGCRRHDFLFNGHYTIVVEPLNSAPGNPWVWRAEFFDAFPAVDVELLKRGWHIVYHCLSDMYGCPEAVRGMKQFYDYATSTLGLSGKPVIFGFSRGGLYSVNYALAYPDDLRAVYLDAPVLDIKSWPGGSRGHDGGEWEQCKQCYGFTSDSQADAYALNPVERASEYGRLNLPTLIIAGGADTVVPVLENCAKFAAHIKGKLLYIVKPGCEHHPHSALTPQQLADAVDFLLDT